MVVMNYFVVSFFFNLQMHFYSVQESLNIISLYFFHHLYDISFRPFRSAISTVYSNQMKWLVCMYYEGSMHGTNYQYC